MLGNLHSPAGNEKAGLMRPELIPELLVDEAKKEFKYHLMK